MTRTPKSLFILLLLMLMLVLSSCRGGDKTEPTVAPQTQQSIQTQSSDQPGAKPFDSSPLPAP